MGNVQAPGDAPGPEDVRLQHAEIRRNAALAVWKDDEQQHIKYIHSMEMFRLDETPMLWLDLEPDQENPRHLRVRVMHSDIGASYVRFFVQTLQKATQQELDERGLQGTHTFSRTFARQQAPRSGTIPPDGREQGIYRQNLRAGVLPMIYRLRRTAMGEDDPNPMDDQTADNNAWLELGINQDDRDMVMVGRNDIARPPRPPTVARDGDNFFVSYRLVVTVNRLRVRANISYVAAVPEDVAVVPRPGEVHHLPGFPEKWTIAKGFRKKQTHAP